MSKLPSHWLRSTLVLSRRGGVGVSSPFFLISRSASNESYPNAISLLVSLLKNLIGFSFPPVIRVAGHCENLSISLGLLAV